MIQSAKRLRAAQEAAVSGKRGANLNDAIKEHRGALDRVQRDLRRRHLSEPTLEKAIRTARATSLDPELWPLLERGLLHEDLTGSGFGLNPGLVPKQRAKPEPDPKLEQRRREAREAIREAEAARAEAEKRVRAAELALARAEAELKRARGRTDKA